MRKSLHCFVIILCISLFSSLFAKEGFITGTLVRTLEGHKPIESIKAGDVIIGADHHKNCHAVLVEAVKRKKVNHYHRLLIGDEVVEAGAHQRFFGENQWVAAKKIKNALKTDHNYLDVHSVERIKKKVYLYALQVQGHKLFVTPHDILVHNAHVAVAQCAQIALEYLRLINPIQATIGLGINLDDIKAHVNKQLPSLACIENSMKAPATKKECSADALEARNYYFKRKQELIKLRDQFIQIKNDIESQSRRYHISSPADYLLTKIDLTLAMINNPTLEQETSFDAKQANNLLQLRSAELMKLEEQIKDLQITIGLHFEAALVQYLNASQQYDESYSSLVQCVNSAVNEDLPTWLDCFDNAVACELRLKKLEDNIKLITPLLNYYKNTNNASILRETSNIRELFNCEAQILNDERRIENNRSVLRSVKVMLDPELRYRGINTHLRAEGQAHDYGAQYNNFQSQIKKHVEDARLILHYPVENHQRDCVLAQDAQVSVKDAAKEERQKKKIESLIGSSTPGDKTRGKSTIHERPGTLDDAQKDFDSLELDEIGDIPTGRAGKLSDGRKVNVRGHSKDGRVTLEIYNPQDKTHIKIRYGNK